jgi:CheY-like chemotaxis protein
MSPFRKVLIVDDNETNLAILTELLESDFTLRAVRAGEEALRVAERFQPGIILLDVMMPGLDGYQTCRRMRASPLLQDAVIIMLSAKAMPSEQAAGIDAGADDYVTKPFDDSELLEKIRKHAPLEYAAEC